MSDLSWAHVHEHASYLRAFIDYTVRYMCCILQFINYSTMNS